MNSKLATVGLLILGTILVVGGVVLAINGSDDGPAWVGKTVAIIVGALVAIAGGSQLRHHDSE